LETSCRVPGHELHGRKCIAVAAHSAAKIKNTKPGPFAITATMTSPMPYPPDAASMARATPTMRNNAARNAEAKKRTCVLHALTFVQPPKEPDPPTVGGHDPRLSPSGQGVPPK